MRKILDADTGTDRPARRPRRSGRWPRPATVGLCREDEDARRGPDVSSWKEQALDSLPDLLQVAARNVR